MKKTSILPVGGLYKAPDSKKVACVLNTSVNHFMILACFKDSPVNSLDKFKQYIHWKYANETELSTSIKPEQVCPEKATFYIGENQEKKIAFFKTGTKTLLELHHLDKQNKTKSESDSVISNYYLAERVDHTFQVSSGKLSSESFKGLGFPVSQ